MPDTLPEELGNFSDETYEKLSAYCNLLKKWNKKINLVAKSTENDIWNRHILDSAQLLKYLPQHTGNIADIGSGAGFPGLVLSILGISDIFLIESDSRKTAFLQEVIRITESDAQIMNCRVENLPPDFNCEIITARAFAEIKKSLELIGMLLNHKTICLFLKGKTAQDEVSQIKQFWHVTEALYESIVIPENPANRGWVVELRDIKKKNAAAR